jgi:PiT family inorganic phosphate transporter
MLGLSMDTLLVIALVAVAFYVGWNIGANDAANCIGTTVGARVLPYRTAALMMALFVILGGALQGHHVMKTIGKNIVLADAAVYAEHNGEPPPAIHARHFPQDRLPDHAVLVALLSAGTFVTLATFSSIPVSTSQAIVGGVAGTGLGIVGFEAGYFKAGVLAKILGAWFVSPILAMVLAFIIFWLLGRMLRHARALTWSRALRFGVIGSSAYVAYSLGANDVGNAIGPLLNSFPDMGVELAILGGVSLAAGALTFGRRVTKTVGQSITPLDYSGAFAAQASAAVGVHMFSMLGLPVSTSQAVVGAVIGVGLTKGARAVSGKKVMAIFAGWIITPLCAAAFAAGLYCLLNYYVF